VLYNGAKNGWLEIREVPNGTLPKDYSKGVLIGPPDLSEMELEDKQAKELNNSLVNAGLVEYQDLRGNRIKLIEIIRQVFGNVDNIKQIRNTILGIYQKAYYPENFEEYLNG
jgi:hypothetical protein